jgi:uncharacterized protein (TIGR00296 family)
VDRKAYEAVLGLSVRKN